MAQPTTDKRPTVEMQDVITSWERVYKDRHQSRCYYNPITLKRHPFLFTTDASTIVVKLVRRPLPPQPVCTHRQRTLHHANEEAAKGQRRAQYCHRQRRLHALKYEPRWLHVDT